MDKFIVSLPRGNSQSKAKGAKRALTPRPPVSASSAAAEDRRSKSPRTCGSGSRTQAQSFLDLGQQSFGAHTHCPACGMLYVLGDVDDEARHRAFCARSAQAPSLPSLKSFHVVDSAGFRDGRDCVVALRGAEKRRLQQEPLRSILQTVQRELGSTLRLLEGKSESILLYTRDKRVLGCLVHEAVEACELIPLSLERGTADVDVLHTDGAVQSQTDDVSEAKSASKHSAPDQSEAAESAKLGSASRPVGATMGVKLIWIFEKNRREGLASRLLDTARKTFEFARVIKKEHVAYSQPTDQGLRLFLAYSKQAEIWGYC